MDFLVENSTFSVTKIQIFFRFFNFFFRFFDFILTLKFKFTIFLGFNCNFCRNFPPFFSNFFHFFFLEIQIHDFFYFLFDEIKKYEFLFYSYSKHSWYTRPRKTKIRLAPNGNQRDHFNLHSKKENDSQRTRFGRLHSRKKLFTHSSQITR